jgi:DNA-directed RNA polymerase subunit beta'
VKEERDALTGKTAIVISFLRAKDAQLHSPRIVIKSEDGTEYAYDLPVNSILNVQFEKLKTAWDKCLACSEAEKADVQHNYYYLDNFVVHPGDIIARIPKETTKVRDIVGGLPRVEELVEARKPKNPAIISEIDGIVKIYEDADEIMIISSKGTKKYDIKNEFILVKHGQEIKEGTKITDTITSDVGGKVIIRAKGSKIVVYNKQTGQERVYSVPKGKFLQVKDGDHVKVGDQLTDGTPLLEEILRIKGIDELQKFLLKEVQMVYKLQGVDINDKHIEIIVRQMLRKRLVVDPGDSRFVVNEEVDVTEFNKEVELIRKEGGKIPKAEPVLVGITRAALSTKSWISAASFQETTRVLTEAASEGKVDDLTGIKENVIIGNLIPAGTGLEEYKNVKLEVLEHVESKKQV